MTKIVLLLIALVLVGPLVRILMRLFLRFIGRTALESIGAEGVARTPQAITLQPFAGALRDEAAMRGYCDPLIGRGFTDAGTYSIPELPGAVVRLLVKPDESFVAAVCEHPRVATWLDLVTRYADGTGATFTTNKPTGLEGRPGNVKVNAPGMSPHALYARMKKERPQKPMETIDAADAPRFYERAYAEEMSWRRNKGVSAEEVVAVANRR